MSHATVRRRDTPIGVFDNEGTGGPGCCSLRKDYRGSCLIASCRISIRCFSHYSVHALVRRVDPMKRSFGRFVKEEIADRLEIKLYLGLPAESQYRVSPVHPYPEMKNRLNETMINYFHIWNDRSIHSSSRNSRSDGHLQCAVPCSALRLIDRRCRWSSSSRCWRKYRFCLSDQAFLLCRRDESLKEHSISNTLVFSLLPSFTTREQNRRKATCRRLRCNQSRQ